MIYYLRFKLDLIGNLRAQLNLSVMFPQTKDLDYYVLL